ncbi:bifunctional UDP-N-acetylmuramoyl-tripeptide:D-alanyl-D-alanine ligase/alanine racemase [Chitinophagaceae bacterium LB-8]|uniref:Alanine racemase n=1 Tax=Paraflavisolibacter caeni TaxID=2982496 RepID=A0A9X3BGV5_9BACT|nr:bifunctional UDP-N-acetylmuramoyl-tripeptide:D-alanyl-D-alanine ligase/alanine racemase [Paraflavisolibacter caeni]MCU7548452.1 bifunctional UDP-N-acetylmuramoyl-tripeptide:D-alanyl-D-alanine ligase/alanine racemase [Paraflavisolibacter caeni]
MYPINTICDVVKGKPLQLFSDVEITELVYDSRKVQSPASALFFALKTSHGNGHLFLQDAYKTGIRNFIVEEDVDLMLLPESNVIRVESSLDALQQLAIFHRSHFHVPVIGITGSNGKTIVKEWLFQLLDDEYNIVRSPKSYNSQIGVPLSVWQMADAHTLAIFEAGISQPGEMAGLERIIQPSIGVLTNIGEAHSEGFSTLQQKLSEKLNLFTNSEVLILEEKNAAGISLPAKLFTWGSSENATLKVVSIEKRGGKTSIHLQFSGSGFQVTIPFTDGASVQNAITCCCVLLYLNIDIDRIKERFSQLHAVDMRLHFVHGINHCTIINDSYSADLTSLYIALNFLAQQSAAQKRTVILSDFVESGKSDEILYKNIARAFEKFGVKRVIGIGKHIGEVLPRYLKGEIQAQFYLSTDNFVQHFRTSSFLDEVILVKGARIFAFERIALLLQQKVHQTVLEINLNAIVNNLKQYQQIVKPGTKLMAMVKAFAYGSGGAEIASVLQYNNVAYLGVAYTDEGADLRKEGISLPIMVMNADETSLPSIVDYNLQPVIYSFEQLHLFEQYIKDQGLSAWPVHLEVETGMNRLGFAVSDMPEVGAYLAKSPYLKIVSMFSHLAASEDFAQDAFTALQAGRYQEAVQEVKKHISYSFIQHIANSAAIVRHPDLQFDMVRLGIGLYGVENETHRLHLQPVATLRTTIAQLKTVKKGETVSYNRRGEVKEDAIIATVRIGYADGYSRRLSNGKGKMWVNGHLAPVIGTICMDMTMIDVTGIPNVKEGDEVIVFGKELPVQQVAEWMGTIPYEVMTSVSQRVKRVYFQE